MNTTDYNEKNKLIINKIEESLQLILQKKSL